MNMTSLKSRGVVCSFLLAAAVAACDSGPTEPVGAAELKPSASATVTLSEFPNFANFPAYSECLNGLVTVYGPAWWAMRTVVRPDGSRHVTLRIDVSGFTIISGQSVWTANPNSSEIFIRSIPEGSATDDLTQHQGTVIFRSPDDSKPDLRLMHQIHLVRLPTGEVQVGRTLFQIVCVGQ